MPVQSAVIDQLRQPLSSARPDVFALGYEIGLMTLESFPALSSVIFKVGASRAIIMQTLITVTVA